MITSLLDEYRARLSSAVKVQESTGTCTPADPKATAHIVADGTGGLNLNEFICYNEDLIQKEYLQCPSNSPNPAAPTAKNSPQSAPSAAVFQHLPAGAMMWAVAMTFILMVSLY